MSTLGDVFFARVWWTADVVRNGGGLVLAPRPGARHVLRWRSSHEVFDDRVEPARRLEAHVGDRFIVCGPSLDETVMASVTAISESGTLLVSLSGPLAPTTYTVQLTALARAPRPRSRKRGRRRRAAACQA